jgi:ribokinase
MPKIVVLASFNMDLVMRADRLPGAGETLQGAFATHLGGKGFNQAVAARRLGADVAVIGRVGADEFGRRFIHALDSERIDRSAVTVDPGASTGVAAITVTPGGENAIIQAPQANRHVTPADIERRSALFDGARAALLQLETSDAAAITFARAARARGVTTILNPAPAAAVPADLLDAADIVVPNQVEAAALTGSYPDVPAEIERAAAVLAAGGRRAVVITLGERGAYVTGRDASGYVPAPRVAAVDTTGAGDAFCAALAVALASGRRLLEAAQFAAAAGAAACTRHGAEPSMPTLHEVEDLMEEVPGHDVR